MVSLNSVAWHHDTLQRGGNTETCELKAGAQKVYSYTDPIAQGKLMTGTTLLPEPL